jgi:hypothetical protein
MLSDLVTIQIVPASLIINTHYLKAADHLDAAQF